jgi:Fur family transcriptional regulator, zinc uptake regulator
MVAHTTGMLAVSHDHHNHSHGHTHAHGANVLAEAEALCIARGLKLTDLRRHVFEALAAAPGAMGAYDLIDALANKGHRRLAPISMYRALDFLLEAGLAHKIASRNAYVVCPHQHGINDVVVFMICDACGRVAESTSEAVSQSLANVADAAHFAPRGQVVEMHGKCGVCAQTPAVMTA